MPNSEISTCPWHLADFLKPVPHACLPSPVLIQGGKLSTTSTRSAMLGSSQWEACTFLNGESGEVDEWE